MYVKEMNKVTIDGHTIKVNTTIRFDYVDASGNQSTRAGVVNAMGITSANKNVIILSERKGYKEFRTDRMTNVKISRLGRLSLLWW